MKLFCRNAVNNSVLTYFKDVFLAGLLRSGVPLFLFLAILRNGSAMRIGRAMANVADMATKRPNGIPGISPDIVPSQ